MKVPVGCLLTTVSAFGKFITDDQNTMNPPYEILMRLALMLWCASLSHHYFCARFPAPSKKIRFLFPLVEMILLISTIILQEEFFIELNLGEIYFSWGVNLATHRITTCLSVKYACQHLRDTSVSCISLN